MGDVRQGESVHGERDKIELLAPFISFIAAVGWWQRRAIRRRKRLTSLLGVAKQVAISALRIYLAERAFLLLLNHETVGRSIQIMTLAISDMRRISTRTESAQPHKRGRNLSLQEVQHWPLPVHRAEPLRWIGKIINELEYRFSLSKHVPSPRHDSSTAQRPTCRA